VIGMLALGAAALDDPQDIERRFSLVSAEISRLMDRIILIERWHAAAAPGQSNGETLAEAPGEAAAHEHGEALAAGSGAAAANREMTVQ
jgi:hypothetical protein